MMSRLRRGGLARGTLLYHGTSAQDDFDIPDGPAWFSTAREVATRFVRWHRGPRERVLTFRVTRAITGLALIESPADMAQLRRQVDPYEDLEGWNEIAEAACAAGFNGWHSAHNYGYGQSDTLLCEPERWVEPVGTSHGIDGLRLGRGLGRLAWGLR